MTQPFVGKVEFQTAVDHKTRLTVDPDSPTSALLISNQDGSRVISIGDPNGNVALPNDLSATRIFVAGRPDLGGLIRVSDRNGREVISIDADARTIRISNPDNSRVIDLGGPNGNVALPNDLSATRIFVAGRPDLGGLIRVSDRNGREVISIDADARTIRISNPDNSRVIDLGGPNGNVALPNDLSATRIFVAGRPDLGGLIRVSDRNGREVISIDADARTIRISNPDNSRVIDLGGPNGNVALPNDLSATRIFAQDVILSNSDCAEDFDVADKVAAGAVVVIDEQGAVRECRKAYDKKVAGVISGAGAYKPAIVLDKQQAESNRAPVALVGKVYCQVDAQYAPIEVGDLLSTSPTPGHAMRADDPVRAFGAVIGKALRSLEAGQGLIPILVALQ